MMGPGADPVLGALRGSARIIPFVPRDSRAGIASTGTHVLLRTLASMTLLTLAWGMNWSVMKIGVSEMPPLWFRGISLVLGTALLGLILVLRGVSLRIPRGAAGRIFAIAVPNIIVWFGVVTIAMTMLPAGRAAILGFTMPVWAALIGALFYREPIDRRIGIGVGCALAGVALLVAGDWKALSGHPLGVLLMLFAAISWAWGTHAYKRARIDMDTLALTFWMMAFACPFIIGGSALFEGAQWRIPHDVEWLPILYNAVLVLVIGNLIWFTVARSLPATTAGLSSMMIPVVGVFSGMVILGEVPSWRDFAALGLICVAVAAALLRASPTAKK